MRALSLFRAILAGTVGLVIGVVFAALVNLAVPANLGLTLFPICLAAILSALGGYVVGARQKVPRAAPLAEKNGERGKG